MKVLQYVTEGRTIFFITRFKKRNQKEVLLPPARETRPPKHPPPGSGP